MGARGSAYLLGAALLVSPAWGDGPRSRVESHQQDTGSRPARTPEVSPSALPPLSFEANRGQSDPRVRFLARPRGYRAFFTDGETVFVLPRGTGPVPDAPGPAPPPRAVSDVLRMRFEGTAPVSALSGASPLAGRSHYFKGRDPAKWVTDVPHFAEVRSRHLYPGVGLRWRGIPGDRLEYDLLLEPGADPGTVAMRFEGAQSVSIDAAGDLLVATAGYGILRHGAPVAWQEAGGRRVPVAAAFALLGESRVGFRVGPHDRGRALVIDPDLQYASYLGGNGGSEAVRAIATDADRAVYLVGSTDSTNFPTASAYDATFGGVNTDAFVTKVAPGGASLVYSTYLGGGAEESANAVAVDGTGAAFVVGETISSDFPVFNAFQASRPSGAYAAFVTKLSASGAALGYSTYLGGNNTTYAQGVAVDGAGAAFVAGSTASSNFPVVSPLQGTIGGGLDAFVAKFAASGSSLSWSTFLGGSDHDYAQGLAIDGSGAAYLAGFTQSADFPTTSPYQGTRQGSQDAFVTKIAADGGSRVYSTYLGGTDTEAPWGIAVDGAGSAWVVGYTYSTNFPLVQALRSTLAGSSEGFVCKFAAAGDSLLASTYLGGNGDDSVRGVALTPGGAAFVAGYTMSGDFPVLQEVQGSLRGTADAFVSAISAEGTQLHWSTYYGGFQSDYGMAIAVDNAYTVNVAGYTLSTAFPTMGPFQAAKGSGSDGFLFAVRPAIVPPSSCLARLTGLTEVEVTWGDESDNETGFRVERKTGAGAFGTLASPVPGVTSYQDAGLAPATTYTYRVFSFNGQGDSDPSNESAVTVPPTPVLPPDAPSSLQAAAASARRVDLSWQDNSDDEDFFVVSRAEGPSLYSTLATPNLGVTAFGDATVLPGRTYSYKVRAQNPLGPSLFSNTATLTMASTLGVAVNKGRIKDKDAIGRDAVQIGGTLAYGEGSLASAFDPSTQAFVLRLGDMDDPPLVNIAAADPGWTLRRGVYTWRSPRGSLTKARIVLKASTGAWTVNLSRLTLASAPVGPVRVTLGAGTDAGHHEAPWTAPNRAGVMKFPVPVPR